LVLGNQKTPLPERKRVVFFAVYFAYITQEEAKKQGFKWAKQRN
jgi:hypothetical protein